ncbi:hypothetical protein FDP25_09675 [Roseovarius sp. A21]|uniref:EpsG family protein n=1 Tax=Roseovarius bejariae TaxID=2576383 RepID=A0A844D382_9RHOB|nr:hypothetical protein [Roseovarius bejariae]MRU15698.1 hypothetical protein [Roseovarius bejariae]
MTMLIFFLAMCFSFFVLNRWAVSDLGLLSYGRVWQLYISYTDFGFFRRGLIGTLLSETGINSIFSNEYVFALLIHHVAVEALALLTAWYCIKEKLANPLFLIGVAFSPAFIIHSGYTTGALDVFVLLFAVVNILYIRNVYLFSIILVAGIFTHELFIFTLPAQFWAFYYFKTLKIEKTLGPIDYIPIVFAILATCIVIFFGRVDLPEPEFKEVMSSRLPNAFNKHPFWSGYFEVGAPFEQTIYSAYRLLSSLNSGEVAFVLLPLVYVVFLTLRALQYVNGYGESALLFAAISAPLLTSLVATDLHRWVAMSANMALLLTLLLASRDGATISKWNIPIALFCFLAPFGAAELERPFPLHQFVLEEMMTD